MKCMKVLAGLAAGVAMALSSAASAAVVTFTYTTSGGSPIDQFTLDSTAGLPSAAGQKFAFFNLLSDTLGYNSAFFSDNTTGFGTIGVGNKAGGQNLVNQVYQIYLPTPFYQPGVYNISFPNGSYADASGNVLTISGGVGAVPEPATWALMLGGLGVVGFALRRRSAPAVRYA